MPRNIEIKARIESVETIEPRAAAMADGGPTEIVQDDTFFACPNGRLKLRTFSTTAGELIFYRRDDAAGPKASYYLLSPTAHPAGMRKLLSAAYGTIGRVQKRRTLYLVGRTRVHLDRVEGLGDFLELEVVLRENEAIDAGIREADRLMARLGIDASQRVEGAYLDLLRQ